MSEEKKENQINIELSEEIAEGVYSNLAIIAHTNQEFVLDFVRMLPNVPKAKVKSRVIMTPFHAKRLAAALSDNLKKYEAQFGKIDMHEGQPKGAALPMNFNGTVGEA